MLDLSPERSRQALSRDPQGEPKDTTTSEERALNAWRSHLEKTQTQAALVSEQVVILSLAADGFTDRAIAARSGLGYRRVRYLIWTAMRDWNAPSRGALLVMAVRAGLI